MNPPWVYTCSQSWTPFPTSLPVTIPLGHPSAPAPSILHPASNLDWQFVSYMILYMFQWHSQCTSPKRPVSCVEPRLAIHFLYDIIHASMPFSQIILPSPSPTESKSLFCTSPSLLLSRIPGYHYHLPKFHIYVFSSVVQSRPILCHPINCSTPGLPVDHQVPEFTQTRIHPVSNIDWRFISYMIVYMFQCYSLK